MTVIELTKLRKRMGLSQADMATGMGMDLLAYQGVEAGEGLIRRRDELAAERWVLAVAVEKGDPSLMPAKLREDVDEIAARLRR